MARAGGGVGGRRLLPNSSEEADRIDISWVPEGWKVRDLCPDPLRQN
jgi:hypothetical protein